MNTLHPDGEGNAGFSLREGRSSIILWSVVAHARLSGTPTSMSSSAPGACLPACRPALAVKEEYLSVRRAVDSLSSRKASPAAVWKEIVE